MTALFKAHRFQMQITACVLAQSRCHPPAQEGTGHALSLHTDSMRDPAMKMDEAVAARIACAVETDPGQHIMRARIAERKCDLANIR